MFGHNSCATTNTRATKPVYIKPFQVKFAANLNKLLAEEIARQFSGRSVEKVVPEEGVEPTRSKASADFESAASASSATPGRHR